MKIFKIILILLSILDFAMASKEPLQKVSLQLQWKHQFEFAGFYAAKEKGYYKEVGLDVELFEYNPNANPIDEVLSGNKNFGVWSSTIILERLKERPVVLLANYFKRSPLAIVTKPNILYPNDLKDKKLMISPKDMDSINFSEMFRRFGVTKKSITLVPHSFSMDDFINGKVDAASVYLTNEPFLLQQKRVPYNILDPNNYGTELYDVNLFTAETFSKANPKATLDFVIATNRGWEYALQNQEEIVELIHKKYNTQKKSKEALLFEAMEIEKIMLPRIYPIGSIDEKKIRRIGELFVQNGEVNSLSMLDASFYNTKIQKRANSARELYGKAGMIAASISDMFYSFELESVTEVLKKSIGEGGIEGIRVVDSKTNSNTINVWKQDNKIESDSGAAPKKLKEWLGEKVTIPLLHGDKKEVIGELTIFALSNSESKEWSAGSAINYKEIARSMGNTLASSLWNMRFDTIESMLKDSVSAHGLIAIEVIDKSTKLTYTAWQQDGAVQYRYRDEIPKDIISKDSIKLSQKLEYNDKEIGTLTLYTRPKSGHIKFTKAEQEFLDANPILVVGSDRSYPPYNFMEGGQNKGYSVDYINLIAKKIGVKLKFTDGEWNTLVDKLCNKEIQILLNTDQSEKITKCALFSMPYISDTTQFATRSDFKEIKNINDLFGHKIASPIGWEQTELLKKNYGDKINLIGVKNTLEALSAVRAGKADATTDFNNALRYHIIKNNLSDIKIQGTWGSDNGDDSLFFAFRDDTPLLLSIINKAIGSTSASEIKEIQKKWFGQESSELIYVALSKEEQDFLSRHPIIKAANDPDYPPYDFYKDGKVSGFSAEYLEKLALMVGFKIEWKTMPWGEAIEAFKNKKLDLLHALSMTQERKEFMNFTNFYYTNQTGIFTRKNETTINEIDDIKSKTVALPEGYSDIELLKKRFSTTKILETKTPQDALQAVSKGMADATLLDIGLANYLIAAQDITNLKNSAPMQYENSGDDNLCIGVQKEHELLKNILNKAIYFFPEDEMTKLKQRWLITKKDDESSGKIELLTAEQKYLMEKNVIKMCALPDWLPFERINEKGEHEGMSAELIKKIESKLDTKIELFPTKKWSVSLEGIKERRCDILPIAIDTQERREFLNFTTPYITEPFVIVTRGEAPFLRDASEIASKKVGVMKGYATAEKLLERYPTMHIIEVESVNDGLMKVQNGEIFGYIDNLLTINYALKKQPMSDLKISGRLEFNIELSIATRNDEPHLARIMQKAVDSISKKELDDAANKWLLVEHEESVDYSPLWAILGVLFAAFALIYLWRREQMVHKKEMLLAKNETSEALKQLSLFLENVKSGLLFFDKNLIIAPTYTLECENLFGKKIANVAIDGLLYPEDDGEQEKLRKMLQSIFECDNKVKFDALMSILPKEIRLDKRRISAKYRMLDSGEMMVTLNDISEQKELSRNLRREQHRLDFLVNVIKNKDDVIDYVADFNSFCQSSIGRILSSNMSAENMLTTLYRNVHTYKSTFRQYYFYHLPKKLHALEDELSKLKGKAVEPALQGLIDTYLPYLQKALEHDLNMLYEALGEEFFDKDGFALVSIGELNTIEEKVKSMIFSEAYHVELNHETMMVLKLFRELRFREMRSFLELYPKQCSELAAKLDKKIVPFGIIGGNFKLDPQRYGAFARSLVHIFRNAVDHGIETPEERVAVGKSEIGQITCKISTNEHNMIIEIKDDGRGVDATKLITKADSMGLVIPKNPLLLIFEDSFTTIEKATDISGRGIGLSSVKAECDKIGGIIEIESKINRGTTLRFVVPI